MSQRFDILPTNIDSLKVLRRRPIGDQRGYLERLFCSSELQDYLGGKKITQINHTLTEKKGTIRGFHYQQGPHAEIKFVSCLRGEVFDVAIDLRRNSPTFLKWHGEILSSKNHKSLIVLEGFAHGFQTLTDDCEMLYLHTASYEPSAEGGINPLDKRINLTWPLPVTEISERDRSHPLLREDFEGLI